MKTLVVYFTRTGHTRQVAQEIADHEGADLQAIAEACDRSGVWGYLHSVWQSRTRATPPIHPTGTNPTAYDLVVIDTPVWASSVAAPVRTYVMQHAAHFRQVAFFCTEGGAGHRRVFDELTQACGKAPVATLVVKENQLLPGTAHADSMRRFITGLALT